MSAAPWSFVSHFSPTRRHKPVRCAVAVATQLRRGLDAGPASARLGRSTTLVISFSLSESPRALFGFEQRTSPLCCPTTGIWLALAGKQSGSVECCQMVSQLLSLGSILEYRSYDRIGFLYLRFLLKKWKLMPKTSSGLVSKWPGTPQGCMCNSVGWRNGGEVTIGPTEGVSRKKWVLMVYLRSLGHVRAILKRQRDRRCWDRRTSGQMRNFKTKLWT